MAALAQVDAAIERLPPIFLKAELEEFRQRWAINEHPAGFKYAKNRLTTLQEFEIQNLELTGKATIGAYVDAIVPAIVAEEKEGLSAIAKRKFKKKDRIAEVQAAANPHPSPHVIDSRCPIRAQGFQAKACPLCAPPRAPSAMRTAVEPSCCSV